MYIKYIKIIKYALLKYHEELSNIGNLLNNLRLYEKKYPEEAELFFNEILPFIIEQALKLPEYLTKPIPLLGRYMNIAITLNKLQVILFLQKKYICIILY